MKHISIIVPKGQYSIVNIMGTFQMLNWANDLHLQQHQKPLFNIELVGLSSPSNDTLGVYSIMPMKEISPVNGTNLIIVPAVHEEHSEKATTNR